MNAIKEVTLSENPVKSSYARMSKAESYFLNVILKSGKLKKYEFQKQRNEKNEMEGFLCKEIMLCIRITTTKEGQSKKKKCTKALIALGFKIISFEEKEILFEPEIVRTELNTYIDQFNTIYKTTDFPGLSKPQKAIYYVW